MTPSGAAPQTTIGYRLFASILRTAQNSPDDFFARIPEAPPALKRVYDHFTTQGMTTLPFLADLASPESSIAARAINRLRETLSVEGNDIGPKLVELLEREVNLTGPPLQGAALAVFPDPAVTVLLDDLKEIQMLKLWEVPIDSNFALIFRKETVKGLVFRNPESARNFWNITFDLFRHLARHPVPEASPSERKIDVLFDKPPDGSLEMTLRGYGLGPMNGNLDEIGHEDPDLARAIEGLRQGKWGPLWVRSEEGQGASFRFEIPANQLEWVGEGAPERPAATPSDPRSLLERNLDDGYIVPAAAMGLAVREVLSRLPSGPPMRDKNYQINREFYALLRSGRNPCRRLEVLHRLLSGSRGPRGIRAIDNGPGDYANTSTILAYLGTAVLIKEPDPEGIQGVRRTLDQERQVSEEVRARISMMEDREAIDSPSPADVVYWTDLQNLVYYPVRMMETEYLGRDVIEGGYLVIQSDLGEWRDLEFDPRHWEVIYRGNPNGFVLPTFQFPDFLQIYRRRSKQEITPSGLHANVI